METVLTFIFVLSILAIGIGHLMFSKRMSEDILRAVNFRVNTDREGGDNWPNIQPETFSFGCYKDLTCAEFEIEEERSGLKENDVCSHVS